MLDNDIQANAKLTGERFRSGLEAVVDETPWIAEVRGRGLMLALEIVHPEGDEPDAARAVEFAQGCKDRGLLVGKGGLYGNVIRMAPMLNVTEAEIDEGVEIIIDTIRSIA